MLANTTDILNFHFPLLYISHNYIHFRFLKPKQRKLFWISFKIIHFLGDLLTHQVTFGACVMFSYKIFETMLTLRTFSKDKCRFALEMCICVPRAWNASGGQKRAQSPGTSLLSHCVGAENQMDSLEERPELLTTGPSVQPRKAYF